MTKIAGARQKGQELPSQSVNGSRNTYGAEEYRLWLNLDNNYVYGITHMVECSPM